MGGGAAMRAAAKLAGIGVVTSGLRGGPVAELPANLVSAFRPASAGVLSSSSEQVGGLTVERAIQTSAWEDWDFAGDVDEGLIADRIDAGKPRTVFRPVPSLEEANDATSELKDALEKVYLSSPQSSGTVEAISSHQETKACIIHESSVPKGAIEAFMLLKERPAVQTVVASIACDPNVWNAMMQNPSVLEFLESEKNCPEFEAQESPKSSVGSADVEEPRKFDGFRGLIKDLKYTVQDMVNSLSNFAQRFFSEPDMGKKSESSDGTFRNIFTGGSLMALVMMVIMMVVLKRV